MTTLLQNLCSVRDLLDNHKEELWKAVPCAIGTVVALKVSFGFVTNRLERRSFAKRREAYQEQLLHIKQAWRSHSLNQISLDESDRITSLSYPDLRGEILDGSLTVEKVLEAYQHKAAREDSRLNFVVTPIQNAVEIAKSLDKLSAEEKNKLPLLGVPISVKECYEVEGYNSNVGCSRLLGPVSKETNKIVETLVAHGGIPFIRTNIPQTMLSFGCSNPIYGATLNPLDESREPGGSSGGDAAAIGSGSALLGIGGDIGGSSRVPAAWSGCQGFKPTAGRLSSKLKVGAAPGQTAVNTTAGPLSRSMDELVSFMRAVSSDDMFDRDPSVPRCVFNEQEFNSTQPLTIGYFEEIEGMGNVSESHRRAVRQTVAALRKKGHKLVKWSIPDITHKMMVLYGCSVFGDGGKTLAAVMKNDELAPACKPLVTSISVPKSVIYMALPFLKPMLPPPVHVGLKEMIKMGDVADWWKHITSIEAYRDVVIKSWKEAGLDALICPPVAVPAMPCGEPGRVVWQLTANSLAWNFLNFPAGVVQHTKVTLDDLKVDETKFLETNFMERIIKKSLDGSEGLPIAVQCVALPHRDELCLRVMTELETMAES